jgi:PAS domain-containing protein
MDAAAPRLDPALLAHPVSMLVFDAASLRVLDANAAAQEALGWSRAELLGMSLGELCPAVPPDCAAGRWRIACADGGAIEVETDVADMPGHAGRALLVTALRVDRRPGLPIETRLHENEERLRLAAASLGLGTFSRDILADRLEVSPEARRLHGMLPDGELTLADWLATAPAEDRARAVAELAAGWARQAREIALQYRLVDAVTGRTRHMESRAS